MTVAPKGIKISLLDPWSGDTAMKIHVHKDGASEAISLKQIADLVSAEPGGGDGTAYPGELVQRISGSYADAVQANGAELLIADNQSLYDALQLRQSDNTQYYDMDVASRFYLSGISAADKLLDVRLFDGKIFAVSQSAADNTVGTFGVYEISGVAVSSISIKLDNSFKYFSLLQSTTTVYLGAVVGGVDILYAWNGLAMVQVLTGYSWHFTKVAGYSEAQDILVYYNARVVVNTSDYSVSMPMTTWKSWTGFACSFDTNRVFALGTDLNYSGEGWGVYEVKALDTVNPSYIRIAELSSAAVQSGKLFSGFSSDLYVSSAGTSGKVVYRFDTLNNIVYPGTSFPGGYAYGTAYKNALALWPAEDTVSPRPIISYNQGHSFQSSPGFNTNQVPVFTDGYFAQAGAPGSTSSTMSGHLQISKLMTKSALTFFVPKLDSLLPGYSYFLRK